jgi:hypothetical protein
MHITGCVGAQSRKHLSVLTPPLAPTGFQSAAILVVVEVMDNSCKLVKCSYQNFSLLFGWPLFSLSVNSDSLKNWKNIIKLFE